MNRDNDLKKTLFHMQLKRALMVILDRARITLLHILTDFEMLGQRKCDQKEEEGRKRSCL